MYHNLLTLVLINLLLLGMTPHSHLSEPPWFALEAIWLLVMLGLVTQRWRRPLAGVAAIVLGLAGLLALADAAVNLSLGRAFNPWLDTSLMAPAYHLMVDNVGRVLTWLAIASAGATAAIGLWLLAWSLARVRPLVPRIHHGRTRRTLILAWLALVITLPGLAARCNALGTPGWALLAGHWQQLRQTHQALADFRGQLAARDPRRTRPLPGLAGRNVTLAFIESYGMSALTDPRYSATLQPRLKRLGQRLSTAELHVATARITAPIQGGQSWLAHASVLSGLWLTSQRHYDLLLSHDYPTLIDDFAATGQRTLAVMPAITDAWPAGRRLGFDSILAAANITYRGPRLNWVTMPDQFTWRYFERVRQQQSQPLFAELALISSHAPWTPIVPLIDNWDNLEGGQAFAEWADAGPSPQSLWQDPERVREHYIRSIDYALAAMGGFAERYLSGTELLIVLGDHQPAPLITGKQASHDVPIHIISGDPALIKHFVEAGFRPGLEPPAGRAGWRQDGIRALLHRLFGRHSEATVE